MQIYVLLRSSLGFLQIYRIKKTLGTIFKLGKYYSFVCENYEYVQMPYTINLKVW